jgi:RNA-directed DNA polymerase
MTRHEPPPLSTKADGRQRPLGIATTEDKIVQSAVVEVLNAIYETDFLGFSYGFRPGRKPHDALDALAVGLKRKRVNWVLDADIRDFFTCLDHGWLEKFLEHRIGDKRVLLCPGPWRRSTAPGGSRSPRGRSAPRGAPRPAGRRGVRRPAAALPAGRRLT